MTTTTACHSLYVHVPFCRTICGYCDFYRDVYDPQQAGPLVDALLCELESAGRGRAWRFDTIFVGGGTPTILATTDLYRLLVALRRHAGTDDELEFTVEANPATVTPEKAAALRAAGVNRVSLGAQSFDPGELRILDRRHNPDDVPRTLEICRAAGLPHLSLDLIFGVPGQTLAAWQGSLAAALDLGPEHLSCYGLTYEPQTPLRARLELGRIQRMDEDLEADLYEYTIDALALAGLPQYEISNFARPGAECRHNLRYWRNQPYLGLGPSAAGYLDDIRYKNVPDTARYVAAIQAGTTVRESEETLSTEQRARETIMLGLRLVAGVDQALFMERFGRDPQAWFAAEMAPLLDDGLLEADERGFRLTRSGRLVGDRIMAAFL